MFKQFFFTLLIIQGILANLFAQNKALEKYDMEGIYLRNDFWRGNVYVKNGAIRSVGFAYRKLLPEFEQTPRVLPMFKKAQQNAKISFGVGLLGLVGVTTGALMAQNATEQGYIMDEQQYRQGINLVLISSVLSAAINVPLQIRSRQQLDDAIWLRNRTLLGE